MSETLYMKFSAQNIACSRTHVYITQLHIMSTQPANKAVEHPINSYDCYWERKHKQAVFIKKQYGRRKKKKGRKKKVPLTSGQKDWAEFYGCIK